MKKILVPVDGSEYSQRAILKAMELVKAFDSHVILLHVMNVESSVANLRYARVDTVLNWQTLVEDAQKKANDILEEGKKAYGDISNKVETAVLDEPTGNIAKVIAEYANEQDVDLIIMGSHGMGSLMHRLSLGSVTNKVLHFVAKPILVVQ